jgi:hypothetical protein
MRDMLNKLFRHKLERDERAIDFEFSIPPFGTWGVSYPLNIFWIQLALVRCHDKYGDHSSNHWSQRIISTNLHEICCCRSFLLCTVLTKVVYLFAHFTHNPSI